MTTVKRNQAQAGARWVAGRLTLGLLMVGTRLSAATETELSPDAQPAATPSTRGGAVVQPAGHASYPEWLTRPLSLVDAVDLALLQNSSVLKGKSDLEAAAGVRMQLRAVALPKAQLGGEFTATDAIADLQIMGNTLQLGQEQNWNASIRVVQSVFEGGRIRASLRSAKLTQEEAMAHYQAVVNDVVLEVRVAYADVLLAAEQIGVMEASVQLLEEQLADSRRRFEAGTVPRFNVLRAEVEVANARPRLIRARNAYRITKNNLSNLLGYDLPADVWEDIPLQLTGKLEETPFRVELPAAIAEARSRRPELTALRTTEQLRSEGVAAARSAYYPWVQVYGGYGARNNEFVEDLSVDVHGWGAGVQLNWNLFDGFLTGGKVRQARALQGRAQVELAEVTRRVELEVRTAVSNMIEAKEVLGSQKKVQEQAEEALRLAVARYEAGAGTQLDMLNAQTSLTEARAIRVQALRDYNVAMARLERATGQGVPTAAPAGPRPEPAKENKP